MTELAASLEEDHPALDVLDWPQSMPFPIEEDEPEEKLSVSDSAKLSDRVVDRLCSCVSEELSVSVVE